MVRKVPLAPIASEPRKRGRPTIYSEDLAARICGLVEEGKTVRQIANTDGFPAWEVIRRWLARYPDFSARYSRAREIAGDAYEAEIFNLMDSAKTLEQAQIAKIKINALQWIMARRQPNRYGSRVENGLATGSPSDAGVTVTFNDGAAPQSENGD